MMLFRFGQVMWWLGAAFFAGGFATSVAMAFSREHEWFGGVLIGSALALVPLAIAFIITGSLLRPPGVR